MIFYYFTDGAVPSIKSPEKKEVCVVSFFFSGAVGSGGKNRVAVDKSDFHSFSGKNPVRVIMRTGHHKIIFTNSNKDIQSFEVDIDGSGSYLVSMSLTFKYRQSSFQVSTDYPVGLFKVRVSVTGCHGRSFHHSPASCILGRS